ncbi:MAG: hypothetical protein ABSD87_08435, partial [Candidatus Acidiferrales bacterium]
MSAATASVLEHGRILVASSQAAFRKKVLIRLRPALVKPVEASGGADALVQLAANSFGTLL